MASRIACFHTIFVRAPVAIATHRLRALARLEAHHPTVERTACVEVATYGLVAIVDPKGACALGAGNVDRRQAPAAEHEPVRACRSNQARTGVAIFANNVAVRVDIAVVLGNGGFPLGRANVVSLTFLTRNIPSRPAAN